MLLERHCRLNVQDVEIGQRRGKSIMETGWMDVASAARKLDISSQAVHALCDRGTLPAKWIGGRRFIALDQLIKLASDPAYQVRSRAKSKRGIKELAGQKRLEDLG